MVALIDTNAIPNVLKTGGAVILDFQKAWLRKQGMIATSPSFRRFVWPLTVIRNMTKI